LIGRPIGFAAACRASERTPTSMSAMAHSDPKVLQESPLQENELDDAAALVGEAGWNQITADWRIFLELGTVYALRNSTHHVVATAATLPYGGRFAWISMVLVEGGYRRQGLATRLLRRCIDDLTSRGLVPVLDATPAGRMVYIRLGFQDSWDFHRFFAPALRSEVVRPATNGMVIRPISDADWPALCSYDAQVFGADRSALLFRLRGRLPGAELAAWRGEQIFGFVLGRDGRAAAQMGPLVAEDEATAMALLGIALISTRGPIYVDLADSKSALRRWLQDQGFAPQRSFTRMVYGRAARFDDSARTMAVAGPELG
jgi:GNAT superfamily N-acetyltransferase